MRAPTSSCRCALDDVSFVAGGGTIVDRVSLALEAGPRTIILGPNGAGKSVLMRLCTGCSRRRPAASSGPAPERPGERRRQAMVFQRPVMLRRSALANVEYALALAGVPRAERKTHARAALERVGLARSADRPARVLSGGEQQRLALARAWALRPRGAVPRRADREPRSRARRARSSAIVQAIHDAGTKIVMVHAQPRAGASASPTRSCSCTRGRVAERAPRERFFTQPATAEAPRSSKENCHGPETPLIRRSPRCAALVAAVAARSAGEVHHRRVDDVDRAVGPVRPHPAGLQEEDRHQGAGSSRSAPGRRSTWRGAATPTSCSCTTAAAEEKFVAEGYGVDRKQVMYNDFVLDRPEVRPGEGRRRQGHARGAEEDRGREGAVRVARRQERHARRRAPLLEDGGRRHRRGRRAPGTARPDRAWGRRSTPRRR